MSDAGRLRDSTQVLVPSDALAEVRETVESEYVVTVVEQGNRARVIGSPVEIKRLTDFLARRGVTMQ